MLRKPELRKEENILAAVLDELREGALRLSRGITRFICDKRIKLVRS